MLVLGTTGSGKTEFLLGLCANAITQNSGFIYVDGKGDVKLDAVHDAGRGEEADVPLKEPVHGDLPALLGDGKGAQVAGQH